MSDDKNTERGRTREQAAQIVEFFVTKHLEIRKHPTAIADKRRAVQQIQAVVDARTRTEAEGLQETIKRACRTDNYDGLDPIAREVCARMFRNQRWELPPALRGDEPRPREEWTLWKAAGTFLKQPEIRNSAEKPRYKQCIVNLIAYFGKDKAVRSLWIPDVKAFMAHRLAQKASPSTVNREKGTLSKVFQTLVEYQYVDANPCRQVKSLSQKAEERQVYLSEGTVTEIASQCPEWFMAILWTAYYTGMRRGELLGLKRRQIRLDKRLILLGPEDTKEGHWKRVPIHQDLVPIIEEVLTLPALISRKVFPFVDSDGGVHELKGATHGNCWARACEKLQAEEKKAKVKEPKWEQPWPRFHDLRHTWRTNARRSGMDPDIAESILGHWNRGRSVSQRYGRISDQELLNAILNMTFDHGETEILIASG